MRFLKLCARIAQLRSKVTSSQAIDRHLSDHTEVGKGRLILDMVSKRMYYLIAIEAEASA